MSVRMVNIHHKPIVYRQAVAIGEIRLKPETITRIRNGEVEKGDPKQIAVIAGIQGAKLTPRLLPLCHPLPLENVGGGGTGESTSVEGKAKNPPPTKTPP